MPLFSILLFTYTSQLSLIQRIYLQRYQYWNENLPVYYDTCMPVFTFLCSPRTVHCPLTTAHCPLRIRSTTYYSVRSSFVNHQIGSIREPVVINLIIKRIYVYIYLICFSQYKKMFEYIYLFIRFKSKYIFLFL